MPLNVAILFTSFGPYHIARIKALRNRLKSMQGVLYPIRFASSSHLYQWDVPDFPENQIITLTNSANAEKCSVSRMFCSWSLFLILFKIDVALLPSYYPLRNTLCLLVCKLLGVRCILMSESWERTASTHPLKRKVKKQLIHLFHSGLVGGEPHRDYYISQGMPSDKLYIGYDVVDNQFFAEAKQRICLDEASVREKWCLPKSYFLSLGRFVAKKNLTTLIQAYSLLAHRIQNLSTHLVFVGSGEMEESLKETCRSSNLKFVDHRTKDLKLLKENQPYVHFFGFKQIHENPIFYSLATAFILPSEHEEWGLVVNEAMACSLPVIVSREAGCAKDLVHHGRNGFQFDPLNPRELSDYMEKFVHEPELKIKMGEESRILINRWSCELFAENAWKAIQAAMN